MKLKVTCICPPIPIRCFDWDCYDEDTYDIADIDGETGRAYSDCPVGHGETDEEAIINFVYAVIEDAGISVSEIMRGDL